MVAKGMVQNTVEFSLFKSLFDKHYNEVLNFVYYKCGELELAEDITQDVYSKAWENINNIEEKTAKSYLFTIASNLFYNHYKRQKLKPKIALNYDGGEVETPDFIMELDEFDKILKDAISDLPEKCRVVFLMNRIDKLTYNEIADRIGVTVKAIEKRMSKAIAILEKKVKLRL